MIEAIKVELSKDLVNTFACAAVQNCQVISRPSTSAEYSRARTLVAPSKRHYAVEDGKTSEKGPNE